MLDTFSHNFDRVLLMTWPVLFISVIILSTIRIATIINRKEEINIFNELMSLCFVLYIVCLFQVVTNQDINLTNGNNFVPFTEICRYKIGSRLFVKNIIGNIVLFMPLGFFAGYYTKIKKIRYIVIIILIASISIECTQLVIGRVFDIDDIILNLCGGVMGYFVYWFLSSVYNDFRRLK